MRKQGTHVKPAEESKTQVAVNIHGKTNEATKYTKESLKQGQQRPTERQDPPSETVTRLEKALDLEKILRTKNLIQPLKKIQQYHEIDYSRKTERSP